jgi:hypothetical protein
VKSRRHYFIIFLPRKKYLPSLFDGT